jgi:hypothetical protein
MRGQTFSLHQQQQQPEQQPEQQLDLPDNTLQILE